MKNILLSFRGFENNAIFTEKDIHDLKSPWQYLKKKLANMGYDIKTVDDNDLRNCERNTVRSLSITDRPKQNV